MARRPARAVELERGAGALPDLSPRHFQHCSQLVPQLIGGELLRMNAPQQAEPLEELSAQQLL